LPFQFDISDNDISEATDASKSGSVSTNGSVKDSAVLANKAKGTLSSWLVPITE
jgi:hypothetical protein